MFVNSHFKCAVKVSASNVTYSSELLSLLLLMLTLFLTNVALNSGKALLTKTISVKEKGGEGQFAIVPTALLRK